LSILAALACDALRRPSTKNDDLQKAKAADYADERGFWSGLTVQLLRKIKERAEQGDGAWLADKGKIYAALSGVGRNCRFGSHGLAHKRSAGRGGTRKPVQLIRSIKTRSP